MGFLNAEGDIGFLPYGGGRLDQPGDLMEVLQRLSVAIRAK